MGWSGILNEMRIVRRIVLVVGLGCGLLGQKKPAAKGKAPLVQGPPETIAVASPYGDVVFTHKKHFDRVNGNCATCHPSIFPQAREELNYKKALHRAAEASKKSCAVCHRVGGTSFAADSNCTKCHASKYKR